MIFISEDDIVACLQTLANDENLSPGARAACSAGARRFGLYAAERVQMQGENESLRADLEALKRTNDTLLDEAADVDVARYESYTGNPTTAAASAERLAKVEDRLADMVSEIVAQHEDIKGVHERITYLADTLGQRIAELVEKTGGTVPGHEPEQREPGARLDTFGRGDEVRLDMALTQGGRRIFGWYVIEAIRTDISGYAVQVSAPEKADPKPLFWIKPEDVLEVRKPTR